MRLGITYRFWWNKLTRYSFGEFLVFVASAYLRRKILRRAEKNQPLVFKHNTDRSHVSKPILLTDDAFPSEEVMALINEEARRILAHKFELLGSGLAALSSEGGQGYRNIAWHTDAISGREWPAGQFFQKYVRVGAAPHSDIKFPRELSRSQHLSILGMAYRCTGNPIYVDEYISEMNDWIDHNPFCCSINWECPMDVAIRAVNWIAALDFFKGAEVLDSSFLQKIETSLHYHAIYILAFLEYAEDCVEHRMISTGGNHYLSDLCGLLFLCFRFPHWKQSPRWKRFALAQFYREVDNQFTDNGLNFENAIGYHRLSLEMTFYTVLMLEKNGEKVPAPLKSKLEKGFEFILHYTKPDQSASRVGDSDDGQFLVFGKRELSSHTYLLQLGSLFFNRPDFCDRSLSVHPGIHFLFDSKHVSDWNSALPATRPQPSSRIYLNEKKAVFRFNGSWLFMTASGPGVYGFGGHTHNDLLSFELSFNHDNFLIDCGTYVYSRYPEARNEFRSTRYHNTVMIDGEEQQEWNDGLDLWSFKQGAESAILKASMEPDIFSAEHYGYRRLSSPVVHRRTIRRDKNKIEILDEFYGGRQHSLEWNWHVGPGISVEKRNGSEFLLRGKESQLTIQTPELKNEIETGWISPSYGIKLPAQVIRMQTPVMSKFFRFDFLIQN